MQPALSFVQLHSFRLASICDHRFFSYCVDTQTCNRQYLLHTARLAQVKIKDKLAYLTVYHCAQQQ